MHIEYYLSFDAETRLLKLDNVMSTDGYEDDRVSVWVMFEDHWGLLDGFNPYCIFDSIRRDLNNGEADVPPELIKRDSILVQLCFIGDRTFYSLNTIRIRPNKVIRS